MSISFHHKTSRFKCTSVLILYLPCCMKCPCFAKTIVSSFVPDLILFTSYGLHSCSDPLCLPSTRPCSTALQCASQIPALKNKAKQIPSSPSMSPCMTVLFLQPFHGKSLPKKSLTFPSLRFLLLFSIELSLESIQARCGHHHSTEKNLAKCTNCSSSPNALSNSVFIFFYPLVTFDTEN